MTLEDLVRGYMNPRKGSKENEVWVQCPFCNDDKYRMGINVASGLAHCFRSSCEWKTSDRRHLFRELAKLLNISERMDDIRRAENKPKKEKKEKVSYAKCQLPVEYEPLINYDDSDIAACRAMKYVLDRGITSEQIKKYRLGFCVTGDYAWRIIFPITFRGKLKAFTGRDFSGLPDIDPKYRNSPGPKFLFNIPRNKQKKCILVEGPIDKLAVERAIDKYDVLGRLGAGLTKNVMRELLSYDEIILWPDPDRGGIELTISAAQSLDKRGRRVSVVMPHEDDVDPGKLGETEEGLADIRKKIHGRFMWNDGVRLKLLHFGAFDCVSVRRDKNPAFL